MANAGLFGSNDLLQELLAKRQQEALMQRTQLGNLFAQAAGNRSQAATNQVGAEIGASFGQGLSKGLFGEGEQIEGARENVAKAQELKVKIGELLTSDNPLDVEEAGKIYLQNNQEGAASAAFARATKMRDDAQQGSRDDALRFNLSQLLVDPDNSQSASLAVQLGGDPIQVRELMDYGRDSKSKFGKIAEDLGFTRGTPEFTSKVQELLRSDLGGIKIINNLGEAPSAFEKEFGKQAGADFNVQWTEARQAASNAEVFKQSINLLNSNELIVGVGGNFLLGMSKILAKTGAIGSDNVEATEAYLKNQGNIVGQVIKQFGSGTGLSDQDRKYAEGIAAGSIELNEGSIVKLINLQRKYTISGIERFNSRLSEVESPGVHSVAKPIPMPEIPIAMPKDVVSIGKHKETGETLYKRKSGGYYDKDGLLIIEISK